MAIGFIMIKSMTATNSEVAGAYMVCWQIEKGIYKGRKIGIPF